MKGKKKLIISLSIAIAVLFIAIVAIVSISAALNQNITSKVKVNFKPLFKNANSRVLVLKVS